MIEPASSLKNLQSIKSLVRYFYRSEIISSMLYVLLLAESHT